MFNKYMVLSLGAVVMTVPMMAQERGTVEFGAFASYTNFDASYGVNNSWGLGARVGAFLSPRVSLEFEGGATRGGRDNDASSINLGVLSARLLVTPIKMGGLSFHAGLGGEHADNFALESYGIQALVGAKVAMGQNAALRVDGIQSWASNGDGVNKSLHIGLSIYRHPAAREVMVYRTDTVRAAAMQHADSVSAAETRRLREADARYRTLRDSLSRTSGTSSAADRATMSQTIHFEHDQSTLSDTAQNILREKIAVLRSNPTMRVEIVGFASQPGTEAYNMALGMRRAESAKAFLVAQGIAANRIDIASRGQGQLLVEGPTEAADAANRRGTFRLLLAEPNR